ncbi:hypothetical protein Tco_0778118, partial [Tanacetum coccineum]
AMNDQARTEQVGGAQDKAHEPEPAVPNPSSSLTLSSVEYGNQFINENPDVSITDILKDSTEIEIQSMVDVPIHQEDPVVQRTPLIDTVILMIPKRSTPTPTPPTTEAQVTNVSESDSSSKVVQRISELEKKSSSTAANSLTEYKLKNKLFDMMQKSGSFKEHEKNLDLYNTLIFSIDLNEAIAKDETIHEAAMETEEPVEDIAINVEEQLQDDDAPKQDNSIWFKQDAVVRPETPDLDWHKELNADDAPK